MNCKNCKKEIPQGRVDLGYKVCVDCSDVERYGCVDIVYHKTGNTIQIMPQEDAAKINKLCLLYTSPSPRDRQKSRMPSSA